MPRTSVLAEALLAKAEANDYNPRAHHAEDSIKNRIEYKAKTLYDQDRTLKRYEE